LPALVRQLEVHDLVLAPRAHLQEPAHELHPVVRLRDHLLGVRKDRPFHAQPVPVVRMVGEPGNHLVVIGPPPVDLAAGPLGLPPDDTEGANVVEAVLGEELEVLVEARTVVLECPRGPEQRRAQGRECPSVIRDRPAGDARPAGTFLGRVVHGCRNQQETEQGSSRAHTRQYASSGAARIHSHLLGHQAIRVRGGPLSRARCLLKS
jgi:hypothetical protein